MSARETQNILVRRASALAALPENPIWADVEEECQRKIRQLQKTARIIALADEGADQRKLDQIRGSIGVLNWLVGVPKGAGKTLERYFRDQGLEVPDE